MVRIIVAQYTSKNVAFLFLFASLLIFILQSGGTTGKSFYHCMGQTIKVLAGPPDIKHLLEKGLHKGLHPDVDIVFSSFPDYAAKKLFNEEHRGRVLAIFRHPVERLISKFYYLQVA